MKKNRLIFYGFFVLFHLLIFFFSLYMDSKKDNLEFLFSMQKKIWMLKYGSFIGLVLLGIDLVWLFRSEKKYSREIHRLEGDMTNLKAKLFDLQEAAKKPGPPVEEQE